ncbi:MAG: hypothetical protein IH621_12290, partial [Krumholzibacteria bacterium]|nr:hypothetical protein [Candidatus Krumholzibacteria bacterium]
MKRMPSTTRIRIRLLVPILLAVLLSSLPAVAQETAAGSLVERVDAIIGAMPSSYDGGQYLQPNDTSRALFREIFADIHAGDYAGAHTKAASREYRVVLFTDTTTVAPTDHVILERAAGATSRYWGTYVFNPAPRRPFLAIQSPHPRFDSNTGYQGVRTYRDAGARAFFVSGTHRCNGLSYSPCDGTSAVCSDNYEPYRYSDMAHVVSSVFQVATEELLAVVPGLVILQNHGFAMGEVDPYLIMSNGTRATPGGPDYTVLMRDALLAIDPTLTAKVAHLDLDWDKLIATTNTQGRLLNGSADPCGTPAATATGRFIHIEQAFSRLRDTEQNRAKLTQAVLQVFPVASMTSVASGDWSDGATWSTGTVPTTADDVLIADGHVVGLAGAGACRSLTFAATGAKLDLAAAGAVLDVHGDFTFAAPNHLAFENWTEGARVRFT